MAQRLLLLDFDGVMLKSPRLMRYQTQMSAAFVRHHTGMSFKACESLNAQCYPKYGHTVLMMRSLFSSPTSLQEYNDFVFNKKNLAELLPSVEPDAQQHFASFRGLLGKCESAGVGCTVFSNADAMWVNFFLGALSKGTLKLDVLYPTALEELKPNKLAYDRAEDNYQSAQEFWMVDDSIVNLLEPGLRPNWIPMHFTSSSTPTDIQEHFGLL